MASARQEESSIFRQSAMNRIANVDDLDKSIKVTSPSAWVVLGAAVAFIIGVAVWSLTAIIPTTLNVTGIYDNHRVQCWVDQKTMEQIKTGEVYAEIMDKKVQSIKVDPTPLSGAEVKSVVALYENDYFAESLGLGTWNYCVDIVPSSDLDLGEMERLVPVVIIVSETHPFDLLFGGE